MKRNLKKISLLILLVLFIFIYMKVQMNKKYNSKSIYVYNLTDKKEEIKMNENSRRNPASLVKIMTVYLALQKIDDLSAIAAVDDYSYINALENNSSMAGFFTYEETSFRDLLYGTLLASGGECANSLAYNIQGNKEDFVDEMNILAQNFGLENTYYTNVDGIDEVDQYTCAKDVAKLLEICLEDGDFYAIFTSPSYLSTAQSSILKVYT